jgi:hypothetical protein
VLHARLTTFFKWAAKPSIGKLKQSPMIGIDKPYHGENRRVRDWFKDDAGGYCFCRGVSWWISPFFSRSYPEKSDFSAFITINYLKTKAKPIAFYFCI